ncbi:MAG: hypothetical protein ACE5HT_05545 [Gemmatimonadales bacterium]
MTERGAEDFDRFLETLEERLLVLAHELIGDHAKALVSDGRDFVRDTEHDLREWAAKLASGKMTTEGFALVVRGKADLAKMNALEKAGLAAVKVDKLRRSLIDAVIETATALLVPKV